MSLDEQTVKNIAHLARIQVADEKLGHLSEELSKILTFVEQLTEVNTDQVEPLIAVNESAAHLRVDQIRDGGYPEQVLANAPEQIEGFFTVPKVIE